MTTVLVAGSTGTLGSQIADRLLDQTGTEVRLLVRTGWQDDSGKRGRVDPLLARGATAVEGDVLEPATLVPATQGVDVVVSALQGQDQVIVDGQIALARAAVASGVARFIPSDFAIDLFAAPAGAPQFDARKRAAETINGLDFEVIHVLNGGFLDILLNPVFSWFVDVESAVVRHWGTGDEQFDLTTVGDTAAFTARLAMDPAARSGVQSISGSHTSFNQIAVEINAASDLQLRSSRLGDAADLRRQIDAKANPWDAMMDWYLYSMLDTPALTNTARELYPDLQPTTLYEHVRQAYGAGQPVTG